VSASGRTRTSPGDRFRPKADIRSAGFERHRRIRDLLPALAGRRHVHVDDLRDKLPLILRRNPRAIGFLQAFIERAQPIIDAAPMLDESAAAYAKKRIAEVLIAFARETGLHVV